jgi:hypothetical protein
MSTIRRFHAPFIAAIFLLAVADPVAAQTHEDVRRELAELREEIRQLREELNTLREQRDPRAPATGVVPARFDASASRHASVMPVQPAQTGVAQPSLELLQTQVAELAQVKVESTSRMAVKLFGTIHMDVFANSGTPNWLDIPNIVNVAPPDGHQGTFSATLRQTRLGLTVEGPTLGSARTNGTFAMDFFGGMPGFATGQVMGLPRLLVAFARVETDRTALEVGQDHMILAPNDPTSLAAFAFPALFRSGNLYLRTPQVRVERALGSLLRVTGGIVAPIAGDVPGEEYRFVPPALGGERSQRPGIQARIAFSNGDADAPRRAAVGLGGHYGWEFRAGPIFDRGQMVSSSAVALDFAVRRDVFGAAGEIFAGENVEAFGGATGIDAARSSGGWAEFQLFPSQRITLAGGAGLDRLRDPQPLNALRRRNRSAYGSAIFSLTPEVQASFEYRWLATEPGGIGLERRNHHFDWVLAYKF